MSTHPSVERANWCQKNPPHLPHKWVVTPDSRAKRSQIRTEACVKRPLRSISYAFDVFTEWHRRKMRDLDECLNVSDSKKTRRSEKKQKSKSKSTHSLNFARRSQNKKSIRLKNAYLRFFFRSLCQKWHEGVKKEKKFVYIGAKTRKKNKKL